MNTPLKESSDDKYDLWLSRGVRTAAAAVGLGLVVYEAVKGGDIEFAMIGIGMMGLPFGKALEKVISWISSFTPEPDKEAEKK